MAPKGKNWAASQRKKAAHKEAKRKELEEASLTKDTRGVRTRPNTILSCWVVLGGPNTQCIFCMGGEGGVGAQRQPFPRPPARAGGRAEALAAEGPP